MFFTSHNLESCAMVLQLMVLVTVVIVAEEFCYVGVQNVEYTNMNKSTNIILRSQREIMCISPTLTHLYHLIQSSLQSSEFG